MKQCCSPWGVGAISLGAYTATSEYFLKVALTDDLLQKIDVKAEILATGFEHAGHERDVAWGTVAGSSPALEVLAARPSRFRESVWPHIIATAKVRALQVTIALPMPISAHSEATEAEVSIQHYDRNDPSYKCAQYLESVWKKARSDKLIHAESQLRVAYTLAHTIQMSMVKAGELHVMILHPFDEATADGQALFFKRAAGDSVVGWADEYMAAVLTHAEDSWSDLRKRGGI